MRMSRGILRSGSVALGLAVLLALGGVSSAAGVPHFSGYNWPQHQSWQYQSDLSAVVQAHVTPPQQTANSSTSVSTPAVVTVHETEHWAPMLTIRTGGVKDGGLFVELTFASAPLAATLAAPQLGGDRGQTVSMPSLTIAGRLAPNGHWTVIRPLTADGALPSGFTPTALVPMAMSGSSLVPPVPTAGWVSQKSFIHHVAINPAQLLSSSLPGGTGTKVKAKKWLLASHITPVLNAKGNWAVIAQASTPTPLTMEFGISLGTAGSVKMHLAMTVAGSSDTILSGASGGLFKHEQTNETVTIRETGTVSSQGATKALDQYLKERVHWVIKP